MHPPWSSIMAHVGAPVTLWHSIPDNWPPPAMTMRLAEQIPNVRKVVLPGGLSHYSMLSVAPGRIVASIDQVRGADAEHERKFACS